MAKSERQLENEKIYKQQHPRKALYFAWSFTLLFFFSARFSARFLCFDVILYYPILCEHIYFFFKFNPRIQFIRFLWLDHQNHVQPTEISSSTAYQTILAYVFAYSSRRYYIDCQSQRLSHLNIRSDSQLREFYPEN